MSLEMPSWLEDLLAKHGKPCKESHRGNHDSWWWTGSEPLSYVSMRHNQWMAELIVQHEGLYLVLQTIHPATETQVRTVLRLVEML